MKIRIFWALILAALLPFGAAWASVATDYDHHADFARYRTYSWGRLHTPDSIWDQRVKNAIDSQLVAKGWREVPSGGDVIVNAFGGAHPEKNVNVLWSGLGGVPAMGSFGTATASPEIYPVGTLAITMYDSNSKNLIWRGLSSDTLSAKSDKDTKRLEKDVDKMFRKFRASVV